MPLGINTKFTTFDDSLKEALLGVFSREVLCCKISPVKYHVGSQID